VIVTVVYSMDIISWLWLNVIGAFSMILFSGLLQLFLRSRRQPTTSSI
jgi:solute:Na+ symporter, SSS family